MSMPNDISAKVGNAQTAQLTYDHDLGQAGTYISVAKVHAEDGPQRDRPVTHLSMDGDYVIFRDRLASCAFVGDQLYWQSDSGEVHQGIIVGEAYGCFRVLLENWVALVAIQSVTRLNGRRVINP